MPAIYIPYTDRDSAMNRTKLLSWKTVSVRRAFPPLLIAAVCLGLAGDRVVQAAPAEPAFRSAMPAVVLWAWEEPEDLRAADIRSVGVAYLDKTVTVGDPAPGAWAEVSVRRRHQPLVVAEGAEVMAVVRVEARAGFKDTPATRSATAAEISEAALRRGVRAIQVDFDATRSQRAFYADVLQRVRQQIPAGMPLSITALTSWCDGSASTWLNALPVDEAVPMFFRLGGRARPYAPKDDHALREPLCLRALGLSTDESWPASPRSESRRTYLFSPTPWTPTQLAAAGSLVPSTRPASLRVRDDLYHAGRGINDTGLPRPAVLRQQEQP